MVYAPGTLKTSFNSGEISPDAAGRIEIKTYFSGAKTMIRAEPVPQGGFDQMPGTQHIAHARKMLGAGGATFTLNAGPFAPGAVVATADLGAVAVLSGLDLAGLTAAEAVSLRVEYRALASDAWSAFPAFQVDAAARSYRAVVAPQAHLQAQFFRLVRVGGAGNVVIGMTTGATLLNESTDVADARPIPFHTNRTNAYDLLMADGHCDVFKDDVFQCGFATPIGQALFPGLRWEQRRDTLLLSHEDIATRKVLRLADADWLIGEQVFTNIPKVDLGGTYPKVAEKWRITVIGIQTSAEWAQSSLELTIAGETAEAVLLDKIDLTNADRTAIAALIQARIIAMGAVEPGVIVTSEPVTVAYNYPFTIEFLGASNIGDKFETSGRVTSPKSVAVSASRLVKGDAGGEPLISPERGYPKEIKLWGARMVLAGFKPSKTAFLASVQEGPFDLNTDIVTADGAVLVRPSDSDADAIERVVIGRHALIFTQEAEYFFTDRVLQKTTPPNLVQASRNGCATNVPVIVADNALFYVNRNNSIVYASKYSDVSQSYDSQPVSLLATHLTHSIVDAAYQRPTFGTDAGRAFWVRSDGVMIVGSLVQEQEITGFVRWITKGEVKRVGVDVQDRAKLVVRRKVGDTFPLAFERMDDALFLDGVQRFTYATPSAIIAGITAHEGQEVWAVADGHVLGPFTVIKGSIILDQPARSVQVGRWTPVDVETLPASREIAPNTVLLRDGRIVAVRLHVIETSSIAIGANGQTPKDRALYRAGMATDAPLPAHTGALDMVALLGYSRGPTVRITQVKPGKLKVRDLVYEMKG